MHICLFGGTTEGRKIAEAIVQVNKERMLRVGKLEANIDTSSVAHVDMYGKMEAAAHSVSPRDFLIQADVFVATAYGASLLPVGPGVTVHVGRLDAEAMTALFSTVRQRQGFASDKTPEQPLDSRSDERSRAMKKSEPPKSSGRCRQPEASDHLLVIDATHPYAAVVSEHILSACVATGTHCIRVEREDFDTEEKDTASEVKATGSEEKTAVPVGAALHWVDSIEEAATWLAQALSDETCIADTNGMTDPKFVWDKSRDMQTLEAPALIGNEAPEKRRGTSSEGVHRPNILITTGSKELEPYTRIPDFEARCYVRALPTMEALEKCQRLGFRRAHLILMQGPFTEEMNIAQLRYAHAGYLVTKASGEIGGFPEKCEAALALGVEVICIGRPKEVSIPAAAWYDRRKLDVVLRLIREC